MKLALPDFGGPIIAIFSLIFFELDIVIVFYINIIIYQRHMINFQEQQSQAQSEGTPEQIIEHLKTSITFCQYSCVTLQIERSLNNILGGIENKYFIGKAYAFYRIQSYSQSTEINKVMKQVQEKLTKFFNLINIKKMNHMSYGFFNIMDAERKKKKTQKIDRAGEDESEKEDEELAEKKRELQKLQIKYSRLMGQLSIMNRQLKGPQMQKTRK